MNKTRLTEKRYRGKQKKVKKEIRKIKENYDDYNRRLQKTKKPTKLQKEKEYELKKEEN